MTNETKPTIVLPIIHMNGTSPERLKAALDVFYCKLSDAAEALRECSPNGRDFYPEPGRMNLAVAQHHRRNHVLRDLQNEIEAEMDGIDEQCR